MQATTSSSFLLTRRTTSFISNILKQTSAGLSTGARSVEATTLPSGIKVVSVNTGSPITTFSVSVRAGSRHEPSNARGVSHIVRSLAFLGTKGYDQVTASRDLELVNFEATTTRELTSYTAHFTAESPITPTVYLSNLAKTISAKPEYWRVSDAKSRLSSNKPSGLDVYLDAAHRAAYRSSGLGNQLIFQNSSAITSNVENVQNFITQSVTAGNTVVVAAGGLSHAEVVEAVKNGLSSLPQGSAATAAASPYAGGESVYSGVGPAHLVLAVEGASLGSKDFFATQLLLNILGAGHRGNSTSDISTNQSTLNQNVIGKHSWARFAQAFNLSYSDSGLFGVYAVADVDTADSLASIVYAQIKNLPNEVDNAETFNRAKKQTLASLLQSFETNESTVRTLTQRVAAGSNVATGKDLVQEATEAVNGLSQAAVKQVASNLVNKPLTLIGGGDVANLPSTRQLRA